MTPQDLHVLAADDATGFAGLMAIYGEAIEASERKPADAIAAYLRDPRYVVLVARDEGRVSGFAMAFMAPDAGFWLLDYMAVDQGLRSRGLGTRLFSAVCAEVDKRAGPLPCVIEIDDPSAQLSPGNNAAARAAFYGRLGCRRLRDIAYILPLAVAGPPPPMQILVHARPAAEWVPRETVRAWLATIYAEVYGCAKDDARIAFMLQEAGPRIRLEPLPHG